MKVLKLIKLSLVFCLLLTVIPFNSAANAASEIVDNYIQIDSVTRNSTGTITVKYTMKKDFKTDLGNNVGQSLNVQYTMNSAYKLAPVKVHVNTTKGSHTLTLPKPSPNYIGAQAVSVIWGSQGQTQTKSIKTVYNVPTGTKTSVHTVTAVEAAGGVFVTDVLPALALTIILKGSSSSIKAIGAKAAGGFSTILGLNYAMGTINMMPTPVKDQVVVSNLSYSTSGNINYSIYVYKSYTAYVNKETPLYSSGQRSMPLKY